MLGWREIEASVVELSDADRHLAEIDENLRRNDLNALERGEHTASRKAWYEAKHAETVTVTKPSSGTTMRHRLCCQSRTTERSATKSRLAREITPCLSA